MLPSGRAPIRVRRSCGRGRRGRNKLERPCSPDPTARVAARVERTERPGRARILPDAEDRFSLLEIGERTSAATHEDLGVLAYRDGDGAPVGFGDGQRIR